jgi:hypothetical protein
MSSLGMLSGPNYCLNGQKFALSGWMDERKKVVSTSSTDRGGYLGRLVAFVDMKVDELVDDDKTLLEINTGDGKRTPNAYVVYHRKKPAHLSYSTFILWESIMYCTTGIYSVRQAYILASTKKKLVNITIEHILSSLIVAELSLQLLQ